MRTQLGKEVHFNPTSKLHLQFAFEQLCRQWSKYSEETIEEVNQFQKDLAQIAANAQNFKDFANLIREYIQKQKFDITVFENYLEDFVCNPSKARDFSGNLPDHEAYHGLMLKDLAMIALMAELEIQGKSSVGKIKIDVDKGILYTVDGMLWARTFI